MTKITISDKKYAIPTSWKDITVSKWRQLITHKGEFLETLSLITDIPVDILERCDMASVDILREMTAFAYDAESLNAFNFYDKQFNGFNVGQRPAKTILAVQGALLKAKKIEPEGVMTWLVAGQEITEIYLSDIEGKPVSIGEDSIAQWYGLMCFFLSCSVSFSIDTVHSMIMKQLKMKSMQESTRYRNFRRIFQRARRLWKGSGSR